MMIITAAQLRASAIVMAVGFGASTIGASTSLGTSAIARQRTNDLLSKAREAIGGEARVAQITSLVLNGTVTSGFNGVTGEPLRTAKQVELRILFPQSYLRIESDGRILQRSGFAGDVLLNEWRGLDPDVRVSYAPGPGQINTERALFARLVLGMLVGTHAPLKLQAVEGSPEPSADSIRFVGPAAFKAILDLDERSRLPMSVRFEAAMRFYRALTADERAAKIIPPTPKAEDVEVTLKFEDRRLVDGLRLPYRIIKTARGVTFEDIRLEKIAVNPPLTPQDFRD